ncbi:lipid A deacylase LpxR family protein [Arachidicoccus ginsenosidimutans]|uniref:lipid A deacylase LpxR family protein n=1 Tax=Arachidicoccus sp. BS20 TaxID=1850526 RepID=UPI0018D2A86F|nr:lipid A deacylase LpxR family protein [Arachidicoccus sp. BS20]
MRRRFLFLFICSLNIFLLQAQAQPHSEFQLISDNDSYTLQGKDGYYTNGLQLVYRWKNSKDASSKTIRSIELGQLMYNAKNGSYNELSELDRPVTAFLFVGYNQTNFTRSDNVLSWSVSVGTIGPPAFGRQVQEAIHSTLGMYKPREWQFQLKTEVGANGSFEWSPNVIKNKTWFDVKPIAGGTLGNTFTDVNAGAAILLGEFNNNSNSVFWNANLNSNQKESFFYLYPQLVVKAYDATVQGGMFIKDKGEYVGKLNRTLFRPQMGWMYANKGFLMNLALTYENKESLTQIKTQLYGTISFGFTW